MTRLLLHAGTRSSLLSRAFWQRPLPNLLLVFGMALSTDLWADHLQGELTVSWLPPHDRPGGVVPRASMAEKCDLLCLLSLGRCGLLRVHPFPSGKCSPSVSSDEIESGPHSSICAPIEGWERGPLSTPPPAKGEVLSGFHCMLEDLIPSGQLPSPLHI